MDAFEFCKELRRLIKQCCKGPHLCEGCPLHGIHKKQGTPCSDVYDLTDSQLQEQIKIVEAWSKEHPVKTMAQDFFEKFPNAPKRIDGGPASCPWMCGYCEDDCRHFSKCIDCWNRHLEE